MLNTIISLLQGPYGGEIALSFGVGFATAWSAATAICTWRLGVVRAEVAKLTSEVHRLRDEVEKWETKAGAANEKLVAFLEAELEDRAMQRAAKILGQRQAPITCETGSTNPSNNNGGPNG